MNSFLDNEFWNYYNKIPKEIKTLAKKIFKLWLENHNYPILKFKQVHPKKTLSERN